jgi:5-methylcytosine-specific restriction endonuclease McrA
VISRPCIGCGDVIPSGSLCADGRPRDRKVSARTRGYGTAWDRLSKRARRLQPWCESCGAVDDLQADHTPEAWERKAAGKPIRLHDIRVLCGPCNRAAGAARGIAATRGITHRPATSTHGPRRGVCYTRRDQISREGR